jgi:tetratricopeptide (TPR) repeat protein
MTTRLIFRFLAIPVLSAFAILRAVGADDRAFADGNQHLAAGHFDKAIGAFEKAGGGRTSAALENNLGLACLGAGRIGAAVAHLRAAEALAPRDGEIQGNLALALGRAAGGVRDASDGRRGTRLRLNEIALLMLVAAWGWLGLFVADRFKMLPSSSLRGLPLLAGASAVILAALLAWTLSQRRDAPRVVALDPGADVLLSPFGEARKVFTAAAGQELRWREGRDGWFRVEDPASPSRYGWVKSGAVAFIPPW